MPVIREEDEIGFSNAELEQLLSLPEATFPSTNEALLASTAIADPSLLGPLSHGDDNEHFDPGFIGDWGLPEANVAHVVTHNESEPDYSKFENWIPHFYRPEKPCDYCRSRKLNCYIQRGEGYCTPCKSLFRECSLSNSNTLEAMNYIDKHTGTFLDTLHAVDEDVAKDHGTLTGIKTLNSKGRSNGTSTPVRDDAPGSTKRNGIRFPRHAVKVLRDWLEAHMDNPYPTEEEKVELEKQTDLKPNQIANWLANARRRRKASEKVQPRSCQSPSLRPTTAAIAIPTPDKPWDELNPFERWKNSPPENEPASMTDIANAVIANDMQDDVISTSPSTMGRRGKRSSNGSDFSNLRAPSTTSQDTGRTSSLSNSNTHGSSHSRSTHGSFGSFSSSLAGKKDRKRRRRPATLAPGRGLSDDKKRVFQCTFCTDTFKSKYDWTRHEKSLHLSLEKWICNPHGPVITDQQTGLKTCAYCGCQDPSNEHLETHHHHQCEDKGLDARTFYRKDHLRQHLRLMHGCEMTALMENWRFTAMQINSRCGFCAQRFTIWQERVDHLTAHFKAGSRMSDWKGCRGLDPAVAAQVTNAMPPYLIGIESVSLNPFSASNRASCVLHTAGGLTDLGDFYNHNPPSYSTGSKATCWEILTVRLGKYAKQMAQKKEIMTDEMLQAEARRILYDSDDSWNQTAADNPEWLDLFKKAHGLDFIPSAIGGQGLAVPEDLETYGDLGLRIPFAVQLQAYNQSQQQLQVATYHNVPGPLKAVLEQRRSALKDAYSQLSQEGVFHDASSDSQCAHPECAQNVIDVSMIEKGQGVEPQAKRWCSHDISAERAKEVADVVSLGFAQVTDQHGVALASAVECTSRGAWLEDPGCDEAAYQLTLPDSQAELGNATPEENISDPALAAARARARGLDALSRAEAPALDDCLPSRSCSSSHLRRHKYQLPTDRARCFETITGAWRDSGDMPKPQLTSPPSIEQTMHTSTGAMMEFLGGDIGASLPFSNDALTSTIPLAAGAADMQNQSLDNLDWQIPGGTALTGEELDEIIRTTTATEMAGLDAMDMAIDTSWMNVPTAPADNTLTPFDDNMDLSFDDMTFDSVFDMPVDETFNLDSSGR